MSTSLSTCGYCDKPCIDDVVLTCNECKQSFHATPRCTKLSQKLIDAAEAYKWNCPACKQCEKCKDGGDEKNMIFCDSCDRGYHIGCLKPALDQLPDGES
uniref:Zinc finger PHD-type domain-containing protein n=1 Tax=Romanomermis culicivorax TaxID=13658 RepID=A0A915K081_ROMCU